MEAGAFIDSKEFSDNLFPATCVCMSVCVYVCVLCVLWQVTPLNKMGDNLLKC